MKLKLVIFLCILTMGVGLYGGGFVYAFGNDMQEDPVQGLLDMPEEIRWQVIENILPSVEQKVIDHIRLLKQNKQRVVKYFPSHHFIGGTSVAFSPDGKMLACVVDDVNVMLWNVESRVEQKTLPGNGDPVGAIMFSPDGEIIETASYGGEIRLKDIHTGGVIRTLPVNTSWMRSVAFSPDGKVFAAGLNSGTIQLWDVDTGRVIKTLPGKRVWVNAIAFSPDGGVLAVADLNSVQLWNVHTGEFIRTLPDNGAWVRSIAFSPDGKILATGLDNGRIQLMDVNTGIIQTLPGDGAQVVSVAFSPDGKVLASKSRDIAVKLWYLYDEEDEESIEFLRESVYRLNSNQKMLLYALHVNKEAVEKENLAKYKVNLQEIGRSFNNKPVPAMLNLVGSYRSLPNALKKVVKDYFGIIE